MFEITVLLASLATGTLDAETDWSSSLASGAAVNLQDGLAPPEDAAAEQRDEYLMKGSDFFTAGGGTSADFDQLAEVNATIGYTYFVADDVEVSGEFAIRYFYQDGEDAVGFNPSVIFRWHWWKTEDRRWTAFADVGIGMMATTSDVPEDGTSFNFTPRIGGGVTREWSENMRLLLGLRWSHISNARIFGEDDNPASDGPMVYFGLIFDW